MTTATWSTRVRHDSDATYQEWRDEFITKLGVLVTGGKLAADETNITPGAGARPGTNTEQGYAVYHLNDSLHGTAPIYIRFGFGTGSSGATLPRMQATVGTSTNGSGVLGGTALATITTFSQQTTGQTGDTARVSYFCCVDGFLGISWKWANSATSGTPAGLFIINRSCDATGAITATGALAVWGSGGTGSLNKTQAFRFPSTAVAYTAKTTLPDTALGIMPQAQTSTLIGSDIQVMLGWMITPTVTPMFGCCGVLNTEVPDGTSFSTTLVGSSARTYIGLVNYHGPFGPIDASTAAGGLKFAMLWE